MQILLDTVKFSVYKSLQIMKSPFKKKESSNVQSKKHDPQRDSHSAA